MKERENTKATTRIPEKYTLYKSVENRNKRERKKMRIKSDKKLNRTLN